MAARAANEILKPTAMPARNRHGRHADRHWSQDAPAPIKGVAGSQGSVFVARRGFREPPAKN
jgi:hypothetical protein